MDPDKLTIEIIESTVLLKRPGTCADMASAALFLVSPENSFISGMALAVDGGSCAR